MLPQTFTTLLSWNQQLKNLQAQGKSIGLIPTMGALHAGHASLMTKALAENDYVLVSIFVNPTQFNQKEDFEKYPRTIEHDIQLCKDSGVHAILAPTAAEMYPKSMQTSILPGAIGQILEGAFRPGHFEGVLMVVMKLLQISQANRAYFGEKDLQQLRLIELMVEEYNVPCQIVSCPTMREPSGLAMSSRNQRLSPQGKNLAAELHKAMLAVQKAATGGLNPTEACQSGRNYLMKFPEIKLEYLECLSIRPFALAEPNHKGPASIALAAYVEGVRLIDNMQINF
jgi:pantoate--beta-alanine ligase